MSLKNLEDYLKEYAARIGKDADYQKMFGLLGFQITFAGLRIRCTDEGFDISPGFRSPGYRNPRHYAVIAVSDISTPKPVLEHEFNHFLHYLVCVYLFGTPDNRRVFQLFCDNVLGDHLFTKHIRECGDPTQVQLLEMLSQLSISLRTPNVEPKSLQVVLTFMRGYFGALTYQHAFYVDPGMGEAVGSFENNGLFLSINGALNRELGELLPGDQYLEGYGNKDWQERFAAANPLHKAFLTVKKADYNRDDYFPKD